MDNKKIGEILKGYRESAGLTQEKVAKACQRSRGAVAQLETGRLKEIPLSFLLLYLKATGTPKGAFFSKLDEMEIKEILPKDIEEEGYPKAEDKEDNSKGLQKGDKEGGKENNTR